MLEQPVGGGAGDAVAGVGLSTVSVGKAGDAAGSRRCAARVCRGVGRSGDFVGDACGPRCEAKARSLPCSLRPTGSASLSQRQLPLQHPCASAPVPDPNGRPGAMRQAHRQGMPARRHSGLRCARKRAIDTGLRPAGAPRPCSEPGAARPVWRRVLLGVSRNGWAWLKACAV
jgi:hypothetical protein